MSNRIKRNASRKEGMAERRTRQLARTVGFTEVNRLIFNPATGAYMGKTRGEPIRVRKLA